VILGVELRDDATLAVVADDRGEIVARSERAGADAGAAAEAVGAVTAGIAVTAAGVAAFDPLDTGVADLIAAVSRAAGTTGRPRVVTRGGAVALAECWRGAATGGRIVAVLSAADRITAGLVADGRLFEGAHGTAGAAGWLALNPVEREDYRRQGCLAAEISTAGIVRRLVWRIKSGDESRALDMAGGHLGAITMEHVFDAARAGDGVAISVVRDTARYIGMAIANIVVLADPDTVLLGGLIAEAADLLLQPSHAEAQRRLPGDIAARVAVAAAVLGADGGPLGAARAAMLPQ